MALVIYKRQQGVKSRVVGLAAAAVTGFFLFRWLHAEFANYPSVLHLYGIPMLAGLVVFGVGAWLMNFRPLVDLLIETEGELAKVSWSSRRDLWKSTWVVILAIAFMAVFMFAVVRILEPVFYALHVLERPKREASVTVPGTWPWASEPETAAAKRPDGPPAAA